MKNVDIAPILNDEYNIFEIKRGSVHVTSKDCSVIKIYKDDDYVGSLSRSSNGWKFDPAAVGTYATTYPLHLEEISEITEILKDLNENY